MHLPINNSTPNLRPLPLPHPVQTQLTPPNAQHLSSNPQIREVGPTVACANCDVIVAEKASMSESETSLLARTYFANHNSCQLDPDFITSYIADEQVIGRYSDAFLPEDLEKLIGPFRTSPLGLVPKLHSESQTHFA